MSITLTTTVLLSTLVLSNVAEARSCYYDRFGRYRCSGLNNGARIGIAVAAAVVFCLLLCSLFGLRRRRNHRANLVYTQNQPVAMEQGNGQPPNMQSYPSQHYQQNSYVPSSQPVSTGPAPVGQYNPSTEQYNGVNAPPPSYQGNPNSSTYAPPAGPPPGNETYAMTSEQREQAQHDEMMRAQGGGSNGHSTYAPPVGPPPKQ